MLRIHASTGNQKQIDFQESLPAGLRCQAQQDTRETLTQIRRQISLLKQRLPFFASRPVVWVGGMAFLHSPARSTAAAPAWTMAPRQGLTRVPPTILPPALRVSSLVSVKGLLHTAS